MKRADAITEIKNNWRVILPQMTGEAKRRVNGETSYICPLPGCHHGEHGDGLTYDPNSKDRNGLKCFSCGFSGSIIDLYMEVNNITDFNRATDDLAAMLNIEIDNRRANENGETPTWNDAVSLIGSLPSAEQVTSKLNNPCDSLLTDESNGSKEHKSKLDLISRQDVIEALSRSSVYAWSIEQDQTAHNWALNIIKAIPSADAVPTVIRSKTLLPTKDFKEWAKRIKEVNPNAVVIPCDAEVASADAEDRLYIKIYADDEPSVKAEKLYQICGETQNKKVAEWLKEYFPSLGERRKP